VSTEGKVTQVVIVEPQALRRDAFVALLRANGFEAASDDGAPDHLLAVTLQQYQPEVVVVNVEPSNKAAISILHQLPVVAERWRTLVLTVPDDPAMHARAIELGAMGVVTTDQPGSVLVKAIKKVNAGELWLDRTRAAGVISRLARGRTARDEDPERAKVAALTRREREIVDLVAEGLKNKQIADRLSISEATVRNHLTSVLDKLDLDDRFELAVFAFRHGLVPCPQTAAMLRMHAEWRREELKSQR
jgi:two-component system nitrate/nitrite response regulator NarL